MPHTDDTQWIEQEVTDFRRKLVEAAQEKQWCSVEASITIRQGRPHCSKIYTVPSRIYANN